MALIRSTKWLKLLEKFVAELRIKSKEVVSTDERGAKLVLWESQRRFLKEVGQGLDDGVHSFNCLKSRQLGITTISLSIDVFWLAVHRDMIGCLVTDTEKNREIDRSIIEAYVNSFEEGYFGDDFRIVKSNRQMLQFSNGSRLDLLVAGTKKKSIAWGEGQGYALAHETEVASYGDVEGLKSLEEGFAQNNPDRLFLRESTAKGMNHWRSRWYAGLNDMSERSFFIGWWAGDNNRIERRDARFSAYGLAPTTGAEAHMIREVARQYNCRISPEQLAWFRWRQTKAGAEQNLFDQNQPSTFEEAFVQTGHSFFEVRRVGQDMKAIQDNPPEFSGYRYEVDGDFFNFRCIPLDPTVDTVESVELKVWEEPVDSGQYVIGCDPAYGRNDHKDGHCLDEETEILTSTGWKKYDQIVLGDEAVCFDMATGEYRYGAVSNVVVRHHNGLMYHFTSKGLDCLATPEHRVVSRNYRVLRNGTKQTWRIYTAEEIATAGRSIREIPIGGSPVGQGIEGLSLEMCRIIGWCLTDGHVGGGKYTGKTGKFPGRVRVRKFISIGQAVITVKNGINVSDVMVEVCRRHGAKISYIKGLPVDGRPRSDKIVVYFTVKEAEKILRWFDGDSERVPRRILRHGSQEQLEALFQGILEGDGGWSNEVKRWVKVCPGNDWNLASDIQELAAKLGYSPSINVQKAGARGGPQWLVRLSTRDTHTFEATSIKESQYCGPVWCVTVPTGTFVARRNGKMFVTGNCVSVFRCFADKVVQVAEYLTSEVETKHLAWVLFHLCGAYRNCMANVEINGPGRLVMTEFDHLRQLIGVDMNQAKTAARGWEDAFNQARWYLYHKVDSPGAGYMHNFEANWRTTSELMHGYRGAYSSREVVIRSFKLLHEMSIVVNDDGSIGAPESKDVDCKDDRVFAAALAVRAWTDWIRKSMLSQGLTYDVVMKAENGAETRDQTVVNSIVRNFLLTQQQLADADPEPPRWLRDQGLA